MCMPSPIWPSLVCYDLDFQPFDLILPRTTRPSCITHPIQFKHSSLHVICWQSRFLIIPGLIVTLTFDLWPQNLMSPSLSARVSKFFVNLMRFFQAVYKILCSQASQLHMTAPCGLRGCKNRAHSVSLPEVVKAVPNQGLDCFVS